MPSDETIYRRLFIALTPPEEAKEEIIGLRNAIPLNVKPRWEPKEKLHITLCFLGDVEEGKIASLENLLEKLAKRKSSKCRISKFGFFGKPGNPNILYAAVKTTKNHSELITRLYRGLNELNIYTGAPRYKPHITLLRIKEKLEEGFVEAFSNFSFQEISFIASEIVLYESTLSENGSFYKPLKKIYLK